MRLPTPKEYDWPLQRDIVTPEDRMALINFISKNERLTAGSNVRMFETLWDGWLHGDVDKSRSLFLHSGTAANLLLFAALMETGRLKPGDKVALPTITWGTTLSPLLMFGLEPVWINVLPETLTMDLDDIRNEDYDMLWVTHLAGMANPMVEISEIVRTKGAFLAEDCCQAYGAQVQGQKVGTFGVASTASFYFGHHMTTIEGGMLTFNTEISGQDLISCSEAMRAHGLSREIRNLDHRFNIERNYDWVDNRFLFSYLPMNLRNTELNAVLGIKQIDRLDKIVTARARNFHKFSSLLNLWVKMASRLSIVREIRNTRNSSFCLPFVFNSPIERQRFTDACERGRVIETRPLAGGVLAHQPAFEKFKDTMCDTTAERAHDLYQRTVYIGNNHLLTHEDWPMINKVWDEAFKT